MSLALLPNAISHYLPEGLKVGYIIPTARKRLILGGKGTFASSESFWFNCLYVYADLNKQGTYRVIINKAVDLLYMPVSFI